MTTVLGIAFGLLVAGMIGAIVYAILAADNDGY